MSVKFRLRDTWAPVDLFQPSAGFESCQVEPGGPVEVAGELAKDQSIEDAYLVVNGGEVRAWPKAMWELDKPAAAAPAVKEK